MKCEIHYGSKLIEIECPDERTALIEPNKVSPVEDEREEIINALNNPIGTKKLEAILKGKNNAMVICDDITRPTPTEVILPILLDRINEAGINDEKITVMIALGTHRLMNEDEIARKVGDETLSRVKVVQNEWMKKENLIFMGKTELGIPIYINKLVVKADAKIGVGVITPHLRAGFTGGGKIIQPGVCGSETTGYTHLIASKFGMENMIGNPENPVRKEIEAIAEKVGLDFIVNVILNVEKKLVKAVAGHFIKAHRVGVKYSMKVCGVKLPFEPDVVIADSHPSDIELWQAIKGLVPAVLSVKEGGSIAFITPCYEGVSKTHPDVAKFGYRTYDEIKELVDKGVIKDLVAAAHLSVLPISKIRKCWMYTEGIPKEVVEHLGFNYAESPQEAVDKAIESQPPDAKILVIRSSPYVLPIK